MNSKIAYHAQEIEDFSAKYSNAPTAVKEDLGAVMDVIQKRLNEKSH